MTAVPKPTPKPPAPTRSVVAPEASRCAAPGAKCIALTFDDGPGSRTGEVLDALDSKGAKATFFVLGSQVAGHEQVLVRMQSFGMEIGDHTWSHKSLPGLRDSTEASEVERTQAAIEQVIGTRPTLLRPPYGAYDASTRTLGMPLALWNVDTLDWKDRDSALLVKKVLAQARPGAVVLMHDIHPSTVAAIPEIVQRLSEQGYTMVTMSELLTSCGGVEPGKAFYGC